LAQFEFIKKQSGVNPILLFDDVFDKLDEFRVGKIIDMVNNYIDDPTTSDSFKSILYNFRDLHADVLASLIIMRTDITEINDHI
jgi:recombinational DNA repair ATPase RecF